MPAGARSVAVAAARIGTWLTGFEQRHGQCTYSMSANCVELAAADDARAWITVPFAPLRLNAAAGIRDALVAHILKPRRVGVLLVRRGGYAVGVFDGDALLRSKVGSSYVQGTTKAGGWSQQRYSRRRDNQAAAAFAEAADQTVRVLLPELAAVVAVFTGGDPAAVRAVLADSRLTQISSRVRDPFFAVPDPRLKVLLGMPERFRSVSVALVP